MKQSRSQWASEEQVDAARRHNLEDSGVDINVLHIRDNAFDAHTWEGILQLHPELRPAGCRDVGGAAERLEERGLVAQLGRRVT